MIQKILLIAAALLGVVIIFYGAVSALVNQGHHPLSAIVTFLIVVAGAGWLVWQTKDKGK